MRLKLLITLAVLSACSGDSTRPKGPGTLRAILASPNGAEGAAVFQITGAGYSTIIPLTPNTFIAPGPPAQVTVVLPTAGTITFDLAVDEMTRPPTVVILEVAAPDNSIRTPLSSYKVTWQQEPALSRVAP